MQSSISESSSIVVAVRCRGMTATELSAAALRHPRRRDTQFRCVFISPRDPTASGTARVLLLDPNSSSDCRHLQQQQQQQQQMTEPSPQEPLRGAEASMDVRRFAFDEAFSPVATNAEIYATLVRPLVAGVGLGFNATLFAYGQTGTGKSYTVLGEGNRTRGLCSLAAADLLGPSAPRGQMIEVSFLELYNERLRDLLADPQRLCAESNSRGRDKTPPCAPDNLDVVEHPQHGVMVPQLTAIRVRSVPALEELLSEGSRRRTMAPTSSNEVSSRSHAIVQFTVRRRITEKNRDTVANECGDTVDPAICAFLVGKLSMVDLAGSERVTGMEPAMGYSNDSGSMALMANGFAMHRERNNRRREGSNINRSLLALGNCIKALGSASRSSTQLMQRNSKRPATECHVPYRDSKLTRLLKESLGGNTRTVMLATVSPSCTAFEETLSTLKYAARARFITRPLRQNAIVDEKGHLSDTEGEGGEDFLLSHCRAPRSESKDLQLLSLEAEVRSLQTQLQINHAAGEKMGLAAFVPNKRCNAVKISALNHSELDGSHSGTLIQNQRWALYEQTKHELQKLIDEQYRNARKPCERIISAMSPCTRSNKDLIREILRKGRCNTLVQERERRIDAFLS